MHGGRLGSITTAVGVGPEQGVELAEPTHPTGPSEAPGGGAQPADVLGRLPDVGQLPVEHGVQTVATDQEVAQAEVTVHGGGGLPRRPVGPEPADPELQCRTHFAQGVQEGERIVQWVAPGEAADDSRFDSVDGGQRLSALGGERGSGSRPLRVSQDPSGDRFSVETLDDQPARAGARPAGRRPPLGGRGRPRPGPQPAGRLRPRPGRVGPGTTPRSRWRMSGLVPPAAVRRSNEVVVREAPPDRRRSPDTGPPSAAASSATTSPSGVAITRRRRQASRRRPAGAGTRRCRSRSPAGPGERPGRSTGSIPR